MIDLAPTAPPEIEPPPARCRSSWIQTYTGRQFWPLNPDHADLDVRDIAHALAMKCRYTGHSREFYSVAQHAVLCSLNCPADPRWALMHDAAEAYLPDVARPVKKYLAGFKDIEERVERVIAERFGLPWPMPGVVKQVDIVLLATERRDLMATPPIPWVSTERVRMLDERIQPWGPDRAEREFLHRFEELFPEESAPPATSPTPIDPDAPLGTCRHCGGPVTAKTLAAAYAGDVFVCRGCDGNHGEPD